MSKFFFYKFQVGHFSFAMSHETLGCWFISKAAVDPRCIFLWERGERHLFVYN